MPAGPSAPALEAFEVSSRGPIHKTRLPATHLADVRDHFEFAAPQAARLGHADVLFYFLERGLVRVADTDALGRSLLFIAALHNHMDVASLLLSNAASKLVDL